jgi:hypothetical protein
LEAIKTYILCQLLKHYDATMQCDVKSLTALSTCFLCADARVLQAIQTQLLCLLIAAVESGSAASGVICGPDNPPVADPGVTCLMYYNPAVGGLWSWDDTNTLWLQLIGG